MYYNVKEEVFDALLTAALAEYVDETDRALPTDEELAKLYPIPKKARRIYKRLAKKRKYRKPMPLVYARRAAVILLAAAALSFGVLMTNSNVRAAVASSVVEWYEKYIQIRFSGDRQEGESSITATVESLEIGYIPTGFGLIDSNEDERTREYFYMKDDGTDHYIMIGIYSSDASVVDADIEYMEYEAITINGQEAHLLYNEEERYGVIVFGNPVYTVSLTADLERSELIKVAENIK